jgi:FkbM family methyltransferase
MKKQIDSYINFDTKCVLKNKIPPSLEQECVQNFFENKRDGVFVDVGANDPFIDSQSFHLEQLGWRGLLIEPLPDMCELLRKHRKSKVIPFACSSKENHKKVLPLISFGVCSTLEEKLIHSNKLKKEIIHIETRTLDSILEENNIQPNFDLLSIDVEGHEVELFKGFSIRKWSPKLILLEDHVLNRRKHNFMTENGYQLLLRSGLNSWYIPDSNNWDTSLIAQLEFIRKYYIGILFRKFKIK